MLHLYFYSNYAGNLVLQRLDGSKNGEGGVFWPPDTYPLESIKEFEQVSEAWKKCLAEMLRKGLNLKILIKLTPFIEI